MRLIGLLSSLLLFLATGTRGEIIDLSPDEFRELALTGETLIIDVRTLGSWFSGHIENATYFRDFVPYLNAASPEQINATFQARGLYSCLVSCTTIVYCRSSAAARRALDLIHDKAGFISAKLYNGHGTTNWTDANYPLVTGPVYFPPCLRGVTDEESGEAYCPTTRNTGRTGIDESNNNNLPPSLGPTPDPTLQPTPNPTGISVQQKEAPDSKCGSLANDGGRGGSASAAKDCSRNGGGRRARKLIRGLK